MANLVPTLLSTFLKIVGVQNNTLNQINEDSYADLAEPSRIDPLCMISKDLLTTDYYEDLLQVSTNLIGSYYVRALPFAYEGQGKVIAKVLNKLKPSRKFNAANYLAGESIDSPLQDKNYTPHSANEYTFGLPTMATEARSVVYSEEKQRAPEFDTPSGLAVGKIIEVQIPTEDGVMIPIKVNIQLLTTPIDTPLAVALMSNETVDSSWTERYYKWKSGRITFFDLFTGASLVHHRKDVILSDENNLLTTISNRRKAGLFNATVNKDDQSYGVSTNIMIVSSTIADKAAKAHRGRMNDPRTREYIMDDLSILVLMVVDKAAEIVDVYYRNVDHGNTLTVRSLISVNNQDGPDMQEVLSALAVSKGATF